MLNSLIFDCPTCQYVIETDNDIAGSQMQCPNCEDSIAVPQNLVVDRLDNPSVINADGIKTEKININPDETQRFNAIEAGAEFGDYRLEALLGSGAMGKVFLATQSNMNRHVALKILPPEVMHDDEEAIDIFKNEVKMLAKLDHPNIVSAYEAGEQNGIYFLAMTYVNGETVDNRLKRDGTVSPHDVLKIARCTALALDYAWEKYQILHRDIKPANIMMDVSGNVLLMDMGIAKMADVEDQQEEMVLGTPYYMSPEQTRGSENLDCRSDQYSLGATLYHLLCGKVLFSGDCSRDVMKKQAFEIPTPLNKINNQISEPLNHLIMRMIAKNPDSRFQSWEEFIDAVNEIDKPEPVAKAPEAPSADYIEPARPAPLSETTPGNAPGNKKRTRKKSIKKTGRTRSRASMNHAAYARRGMKPGTLIFIIVSIPVCFYLLMGFLNASGVFEANGLRFPSGLFPEILQAPSERQGQ